MIEQELHNAETRKLSRIKIGPRIRKDLGNIDELAQSIQELGLLHPVVINDRNELIAGARRIAAFQKLHRTEIPVTVVTVGDIVKGELQENIMRKRFTISEMVAIKRRFEPELKAEGKGQGSKRLEEL